MDDIFFQMVMITKKSIFPLAKQRMTDAKESIVLPPLAADKLDETLKKYFEAEEHAQETVLVYLYANIQAVTGKSVSTAGFLPVDKVALF